MRGEVESAQSQGGGVDVMKQGIVVLVNRSGKIVRRGLGVPPWKEVVTETCGISLSNSRKEKEEKEK